MPCVRPPARRHRPRAASARSPGAAGSDTAAQPIRLESRAAMDLLEYQGKELFAKHGLAVSAGKAVTMVPDAVSAANELGYPVVVKAQVLIGGRGKAGGVKLAADEAQVRDHAENILGMD